MPFDPNSAKKAGKKSKRGPAKKEEPSIKEKMELLYEKVLDDLLINQDKLTYDNVALELNQKGFDEWMIWNPGQTLAKSIPDLPNNDWENFICIEPVIVSKPKILKSGAIFDGTLNIDIIIK